VKQSVTSHVLPVTFFGHEYEWRRSELGGFLSLLGDPGELNEEDPRNDTP
jgi:hypothetical protein